MSSDLFRTIVKNTVAQTFPVQTRGRPVKITFDLAYDSIVRIVKTGMQWRELHCENISYITVFKTLHKWSDANIFQTAYTRLLRLYNRRRRPKYYCIDSTFVKNQYGRDVVGRNPTDRGRKATKYSVLVDDRGMPHSFLFTPANESDMKLLDRTLGAALRPLQPNVIGIMRFVVSLVANHVVLSNAHAVEHGNMFLFFTQVWRYNVRNAGR